LSRDGGSIWDSERPINVVISLFFWVAAFLTYASAFRDQPHALFALACLIIGRFTSTFVHECGHAIAALACRWRIILFVVRPIGIQIPNRNLAIIRRSFKTELGGWVATVPGAPSVDTQRSWSIILAAGPAASFLLAAVAILGSVTWLRAFDGAAVAVSRIGIGLAVQSLHSCVLTLLPTVRSGNRSDGEKLRALGRGENDYELNRPLIWLETMLSNNVRLSAVPDWLVSQARATAGESEDGERFLASLDIGRALDSAQVDTARARTLIEAFRERHGVNGWLAACDVYLAAVWEGDADRAKAALSGIRIEPAVPELSLAAEAAVAARSGETALARSKLREMREAVKRKSPFKDLTFRDIRRQIERLLTDAKRQYSLESR
jgi:hypothetical protein